MIEIKITAAESGGRMDKYLLKVLDKAPKNFVYKMLRKKNIVLNKKKSAGNEILKEGDIINLFLADETYAKFHTDTQQKNSDKKPQSPSISLEQIRQLLAYEDDNILAFNKPAGLLSQKAKLADTSLNDLLVCYLEETGFTGPTFVPGISNRLDRNTSGLVLAGKNPAASRELNNSIRDRSISKIYLALVLGDVKEAKTVEGYLIKDEKKNTVTVRKTLPEGESDKSFSEIRTAYKPIESNGSFTLLEVDLITGKAHQIRAHLASLGHPLIGDPKYGDPGINRRIRCQYGLNRQFLHAFRIEFQSMEGILSYLNGNAITAKLPSDLKKVLKGEHIWQHGGAEDSAENSSKS